MPNPIRLVLALHNHQPVGNFEHVFQQAYEDSYLPFLDVFSRYESLRIALHTSGSLMEWLDAAHPEYVDRLAELASKGRIEIIGGAFFEPILAMIPSRDRIGQIRKYTRWLQNRLGTTIRGMWMPERVWEQAFTRDLVDAGIEYTILDDFHFKTAGLTDAQLQGYLVTEDEGRLLNVFPGSERLRYTIPFASPQETIDHLARLSEQRPGAICLFGDDGEKFGTWPETKKHVYEDGWLTRFFDALVANQSWLQVTTPSEAIDNVPPVGKIYLPDCSYREMTEWALPTEQLIEYDRITHEMNSDGRLAALQRFVGGGYWRNFKVKYPEADEMYCRMMMVSRRLQDAIDDGATGQLVEAARTELYRAQCNCSHWHGAFGGIYLPHLRNAVYHSLIAADEILDRLARRPQTWVEAAADDYNFDARQEICLSNDRMLALVLPSRGGMLAELDVRSIRHNLLATLSRQPEAYHRKVLAGATGQNGQCASIHDRVVFKQANLDQRIQYDKYPRKALIDLFFDNEATLDAVAAGQAELRGDFATAIYEAKIRRNAARIQVQLVREGQAGDPRGCRAGADHQGPDVERGKLDAADRLSVGEPAAGPPAALCRGDELCRAARRGRRPLLPRRRWQPFGPTWRPARSGRDRGVVSLRRVAGDRRGPDRLAADAFLDLPHRDSQPERGRLRAGPSIDGRVAALVRHGRPRRPLVGGHAIEPRHWPRREPRRAAARRSDRGRGCLASFVKAFMEPFSKA